MSDSLFSSLKPFEKVRQFLDNKEKAGELSAGKRLPTAEELAAQLGVSAGTVKNVYRTLAAEGRVRSQVGVGSFWQESRTPPKAYRIGFVLNHVNPVESDWWTRNPWCGVVFGGVLHRKLECPQKISLEMSPSKGDHDERFDALIDLSLRQSSTLGGAETPVRVHLNPPRDQACSNFVSPDYFECSRALGEAWRLTGRRRVLFLAPVALDRSVSTRLRYSGLLCGLGDAIGSAVEVRLWRVPHGGHAGGRGIGALIDECGWMPDAVYCVGDIMARDVVEELLARGRSIPEEISVVGGCKTESVAALPPLTSMVHPLAAVGSALFDMALLRLERGGQAVPGVIKPVPFSIGATTRLKENEILARHAHGSHSDVPSASMRLL